MRYLTCNLWPVIDDDDAAYDDDYDDDSVYDDYRKAGKRFMFDVDDKFLISDDGSNRCYIQDVPDNDSDIDTDHNKQMETIHRQTAESFTQLLQSNPRLTDHHAIGRIRKVIEKEESTLQAAKLIAAVKRHSDARAIAANFAIHTEMQLAALKQQFPSDSDDDSDHERVPVPLVVMPPVAAAAATDAADAFAPPPQIPTPQRQLALESA